jgi:hypothetical protein
MNAPQTEPLYVSISINLERNLVKIISINTKSVAEQNACNRGEKGDSHRTFLFDNNLENELLWWFADEGIAYVRSKEIIRLIGRTIEKELLK